MAYDVKFYRGLASDLPTARDSDFIYVTTDTGQIYLGDKELDCLASSKYIAKSTGGGVDAEDAIIKNVSAGLSDTDAVNVAQLNAAVSALGGNATSLYDLRNITTTFGTDSSGNTTITETDNDSGDVAVTTLNGDGTITTVITPAGESYTYTQTVSISGSAVTESYSQQG